MSNKLNMVRVTLDAQRLMDFAKRRGIPLYADDYGYAVHCALVVSFGNDCSPKPFSIGKLAGRNIEILGYTFHSTEDLVKAAKSFAKPDIYAISDWKSFNAKQMPATWKTGSSYMFKTVICPVVRISGSKILQKKENAETDAFLSAVGRKKPEELPLLRETVYREWLAKELARDGAAKLEVAQMQGFRLIKIVRRNKERAAGTQQRPEAQFEGTLIVENGESFHALLSRGLGRHRSFGYGMLLLIPVR
jgi:CRISPR system Cascade subunit CasE